MRSAQEVKALARQHLELSDDEDVSPAYLAQLTDFLESNPDDTNILGEEGGGHGFGTITCLEELCWCDVMLEADPNPARVQGGKKDGWGSFFQLQEHCKDPKHIKGRNQRLEKQGMTPSSLAALPAPAPRSAPTSSPSSSARRSGVDSLSLLSALDGMPRPSPVSPMVPSRPGPSAVKPERLVTLDANTASTNFGRSSQKSQLKDVKPSLSTPMSKTPIVIDDRPTPPSWDKDEVEILAEAPEGMRKVTNKDAPISLLDSDSDDDGAGRSGSQRRHGMSFQDKARNAKLERDFLRGLMSGAMSASLSEEQLTSVVDRYAQLRPLVDQAGLGVYERPNAHLMSLPGMSHFVEPWERAGLCPKASAFETDRVTAARETQQGSRSDPARRDPFLSLSSPTLRPGSLEERTDFLIRQLDLANRSTASRNQAYPGIGMPGMPGGIPLPIAGSTGLAALGLPSLMPLNPLTTDWQDDTEYDRPRDAQGLSDFFKSSMDDFQEDTTIETDLVKLGLKDLNDKLPGMKITLMPHQVIGVAWMITKEKTQRLPGGILGDEMGLGKTIQTIATMVANPSQDPQVKTTLIIVPLALLRQWRLEIEEKSNLKVGVYHNSVGKEQNKAWFKQYDVILTTLGTMTGERGGELDNKKKKKKAKKNGHGSNAEDSFIEDDEADQPIIKPKGILFKIHWYRIVLDEAAVIRNRNAKSSKAILGLNSHIHWALTGTLVYNSLSDVFPLLNFTKRADWKDYNDRIVRLEKKKPRLASQRAQAMLKPHLLRRTKQSTLNGQRLLNLPEKTVEMEYILFSPEEAALYKAVEARARLRVNKWLKRGDNVKTWRCAFVLLTRLRQLCDHPFLLRAQAGQTGDDVLEVTDEELFGGLGNVNVNNEEEVARAVRMEGADWVESVRKMLKKRNDDAAKQRGGVKNEEPNGVQDEVNMECPICYDLYADERITACKHSFCATCVEDIFQAAPRDAHLYTPQQLQRDVRTCPMCRKEMARNTIYRAEAFLAEPEEKEDSEDEDEAEESDDGHVTSRKSSRGKKRVIRDDSESDAETAEKKKGKGKARAGDDEDELAEDNKPVFVNGLEGIPPSSKLEKQVEIMDQWYQADPTQKVLCFSSFVQYLKLVAAYLRTKSINYELYTGEMSQLEREETIKRFTGNDAEDAPRVMLISLKCGGVGLNLTRANLVISLDLAWSPASENQAIDRAHRIGQTRPVLVKRLIVRDSVEERMLELQDRKQALADGAMGEGTGAKLGRMTLRDLISLFGHERDNERE